MPESLKTIDTYAFYDCKSITALNLPSLINSIGDSAFNKCLLIEHLIIPSSLRTIGAGCFAFCDNLIDVEIQNGLQTLNGLAVNKNLVSVKIPISVRAFAAATFANDTQLTDIYYAGTQAQWNSISKGTNWNYNTGAYTIHCTDGDLSK